MRLRRGQENDPSPSGSYGHDDDLVELTRVALIAEAVAIKQDLEGVGIPAVVFESDAGGWAPHYGIAQGHRVMIRSRDQAEAAQLLSDVGGQVAIEPLPSPSTVKKHLRRHESG